MRSQESGGGERWPHVPLLTYLPLWAGCAFEGDITLFQGPQSPSSGEGTVLARNSVQTPVVLCTRKAMKKMSGILFFNDHYPLLTLGGRKL